jgi:hypothetical protein
MNETVVNMAVSSMFSKDKKTPEVLVWIDDFDTIQKAQKLSVQKEDGILEMHLNCDEAKSVCLPCTEDLDMWLLKCFVVSNNTYYPRD